MNIISKKEKSLIMTIYIYIIFICIGMIILYNNTPVKLIDYINFITIAMLIWNIYSWTIIEGEFFCAYNIYTIVSFCFLSGRNILANIKTLNFNENLFWNFTDNEVIAAQFFTLACLGVFHICSILAIQRKYKSNKINSNRELDITRKSIYYTGWILLLISIIPVIIDTLYILYITNRYGYLGIYENKIDGILQQILTLKNYFIPSIILLCSYYYKINIKKTKCFVFISILYAIILMTSGGRGKEVNILIVAIIMYHIFVTPVKGYKILVLSIVGYIGVSLLSIIQIIRIDGVDYSKMLHILINGNENYFIKTIYEMGFSIYPILNIMNLVPSIYDYSMGTSYLFSFTTLIPTIFTNGINYAEEYSTLSIWLQEALNMSWGPGFSLVAEAFKNFGWYGIFIFIVLGILFSKLFTKINKNTLENNPISFCLGLMSFSFILMLPRQEFLSLVVNISYFVIVPYILLIVVKNYIAKNYKNKIDNKSV